MRNGLPMPLGFDPEDRVQLLSSLVTVAETSAELNVLLPKLQAAIRDHISHVRTIAVETIPETFGKRAPVL